jgi:hypothetical protein
VGKILLVTWASADSECCGASRARAWRGGTAGYNTTVAKCMDLRIMKVIVV